MLQVWRIRFYLVSLVLHFVGFYTMLSLVNKKTIVLVYRVPGKRKRKSKLRFDSYFKIIASVYLQLKTF